MTGPFSFSHLRDIASKRGSRNSAPCRPETDVHAGKLCNYNNNYNSINNYNSDRLGAIFLPFLVIRSRRTTFSNVFPFALSNLMQWLFGCFEDFSGDEAW